MFAHILSALSMARHAAALTLVAGAAATTMVAGAVDQNTTQPEHHSDAITVSVATTTTFAPT
ncbi:MAG: hypothetical protein ABJB39_09035, partial [Chloroflexota bacterium]